METTYQCYFVDENGDRCKKEQADCWCSPEHKKLEQASRYSSNRPRGQRQLTPAEMAEGFKEMAKKAREKEQLEKMDPNGQMKI